MAVAELLGFANLAPAVLARDGIGTPWGLVPDRTGPPGATTALVRPAGVRLDADGPSAGVVAARAFAGDRSTVTIEVDGGPPIESEVATVDAPPVGTRVRFRIDPAEVDVLLP